MLNDEIVVKATVTGVDGETTLLDYLSSRFTYLPRTGWQELIAAGKVTVAGLAATSDESISNGLTITSRVPAPAAEIPAYSLCYEDTWLFGINKPAGLPCHGRGRFMRANLIYHLRARFGSELRLVNRLDRNTSGIVIVARDRHSATQLQGQFAAQTVSKRYLAHVHGQLPLAGTIALSLREVATADGQRGYIAPANDGRPARTDYRRLSLSEEGYSLVALRPRTGRTHQIRVHLAAIGHPVVGDWQYGRPTDRDHYDRHLLHCAATTFMHPITGLEIALTAAPPPAFKP